MADYNYFPDVRAGDDPFVGVFVGRKGSGKTTLLMDLLKSVWKLKFNLIVIVSPTFSTQNVSSEIEDGRGIVIIPEFRLSIIDELAAYQLDKILERERILSTPKEFVVGSLKVPEVHHALLIFDDIGTLGKEGKLAVQLANLAYIVRHRNVSIIELAQRITLASTGLSSQADVWIFFCEQNPNERVNIFRRIGFGNNVTFWNIFDRETSEVRAWIGIRNISGRNIFFNKEGFISC